MVSQSGTEEGNRFYVVDNGHKRRLPRYYKDRIFTKEEKDAYNVTLKAEREEAEITLFNSIRKISRDPSAYYEAQRQYAHDLIGKNHKKSQSLKKLT